MSSINYHFSSPRYKNEKRDDKEFQQAKSKKLFDDFEKQRIERRSQIRLTGKIQPLIFSPKKETSVEKKKRELDEKERDKKLQKIFKETNQSLNNSLKRLEKGKDSSKKKEYIIINGVKIQGSETTLTDHNIEILIQMGKIRGLIPSGFNHYNYRKGGKKTRKNKSKKNKTRKNIKNIIK